MVLNDDEKESCYQEKYFGENTNKLNEICQQQLGKDIKKWEGLIFHAQVELRSLQDSFEGGKLPMYKVFEEDEMAKMCRVIGKLYNIWFILNAYELYQVFFRAIEK